MKGGRTASKQTLEKSTLVPVRLVGALIDSGTQLLLFFHLETCADKLVNLIRDDQMALVELSIDIVARIGFQMKRMISRNSSLFLLSAGLLASRSV